MKQLIALAMFACASVVCAGVRTNDYSWVKGVCYSFKDDATTARELGYGKRVGLNAVRVWLNFYAWRNQKSTYATAVRDAIRRFWKNGYYTMPILLNGNCCAANLITPAMWPEQQAYIESIVSACKDEPGLLMWDIMNEPACGNRFIDGVATNQTVLAKHYQILDQYLVRATKTVKAKDRTSYTTIGYTTSWEIDKLPESLKVCDVISFHDYQPTRAKVAQNFDHAAEFGRKLGRPVMQTETGCLARANPYDVAIAACQERKMGYILYELMIHGRCDDEHGIFYPNGTVRDPATIAAIMGCYRNRDLESIVVGSPNREMHAQHALRQIQQALTVVSRDGLARPVDTTKQLLDACEYAANLLEGCHLVPMAVPPTARVMAWRKMKKPPLLEIREFAFELAQQLRKGAQLP